ncbi:MAG: hypothetical protein ACD_71C00236G0006 [uncultured bacterium (gcode 4)]|uniref:Spore protein YkvP/CgeB glycosyl transferase-like domain-containing protein n=1 Tax=uncultured bacterium (gcode 4) TaxID=1234023 RepID=K1Z4C8_9BACT|nr:MAG: hypothetical protein ACD_71C00236G0006 [uncultured bacterium (gcode 4)]
MKDIVIENYNFWEQKVAFFLKDSFWDPFVHKENLERIAKHNNLDIHLFDIKNNKVFWRHIFYMYPNEFEKYYIENEGEYAKYYNSILEYVRNNNIKVCIFFWNVTWWHDSFLNEVRKECIIASYIVDDDVEEVANRISRPYVRNFDWAFCWSVYFKWDEILMKDKYIEWWAKSSDFIPLWLYVNKYDEDNSPDFINRDIDLLYVWWIYFKKVLKIMKLKKHFWDRMKIYWRWWNGSTNVPKTLILKALKWYYDVGDIEELPSDKFVEIYRRTKIGFNIHQEYWPTNMRTYELPANWAMLICDNWKWLNELFAVWKEAVSYEDIDEAIRKIEYYLENDEERRKIAEAGHKKAVNNYKMEQSFEKMVNLISRKK